MTPRRLTTVLFDLDGVLVDSQACVNRCWRRWADERGLDPVLVDGFVHGRPAREIVAHFAPDLDAGAEERRITEWQIEDGRDVVAIPGVAELLASLRSDAWAIVTSGPRDLALSRIGAAGLPEPTLLISADDVADGKPAPDAYALAAERLGVDASSSRMPPLASNPDAAPECSSPRCARRFRGKRWPTRTSTCGT